MSDLLPAESMALTVALAQSRPDDGRHVYYPCPTVRALTGDN